MTHPKDHSDDVATKRTKTFDTRNKGIGRSAALRRNRPAQIVPRIVPQLMQDKDPEKRNRVMKALLKMVKLDIAALQRAYNGQE